MPDIAEIERRLSNAPQYETGGFFQRDNSYREQHYFTTGIQDSLETLHSYLKDPSGQIINIMTPEQKDFLARFTLQTDFTKLVPTIVLVMTGYFFILSLDKIIAFFRLVKKEGLCTAIQAVIFPANRAIGALEDLGRLLEEKGSSGPTVGVTLNVNDLQRAAQQQANLM